MLDCLFHSAKETGQKADTIVSENVIKMVDRYAPEELQ